MQDQKKKIQKKNFQLETPEEFTANPRGNFYVKAAAGILYYVLPPSRNVCRFRDEIFFCVGDSAVLADWFIFALILVET